jgi:DNA-binding transcriptional LysR family regulator
VERLGLVWVPIPLPMPPLRLSLAWHARYDADPAHAWLRRCVRETIADVAGVADIAGAQGEVGAAGAQEVS